jgi:hypothetical protein
MEIILSKQCESLTGSLGSGFGYHIQRRKNGFFAKRDSKGSIPPDGHLNFILTCADLAQSKLHIADIRVSAKEFRQACWQANMWYGHALINAKDSHVFNAKEVLHFKQIWGL